jgi:DNA processing protein
MAVTVSLAEKDELATLLVAGRSHRDLWLPLRGSRDSGFKTPGGSLELVDSAVPNADLRQQIAAREEIETVQSDPAVRVIAASSREYPARLRDLDGRPALLFVRGDLTEPSKPPLAIAGSRKASTVGVHAAQQVAGVVASAGHVVISGLAAGIDAAGHRGALDSGGHTIAVMGTGLGKVFPQEHRPLADRIAKQGALVTQFPPMYPPTKTTFPARNMLIAGLSDVSLLIEMNEYSGTRIEADCALAQGKRVLLWSPLLESQEWARRFAEQPGVTFVETAEDVLAQLSVTS